jgi:PTH1 family peptidyl-tRNA hydrolase
MPIRCVVGLGNPGPRYEWTRHNAGFWVVDQIARDAKLLWRQGGRSLEAVGLVDGERVTLLKPQTYVNRSGLAVRDCLERCMLTPEEILVVVDDVDLPPSRLRLRRSGSSGGHRGLESIAETIGSGDYARLRIGVGREIEDEDLPDYLLRPIDPDERGRFEALAKRGAEAVREAIGQGLESAMNRFNQPPVEAADEQVTSGEKGSEVDRNQENLERGDSLGQGGPARNGPPLEV